MTFDPPARQQVSFFETTIRLVGGLMSAHDLSGHRLFLDKAQQLGARLLPVFDGTRTGEGGHRGEEIGRRAAGSECRQTCRRLRCAAGAQAPTTAPTPPLARRPAVQQRRPPLERRRRPRRRGGDGRVRHQPDRAGGAGGAQRERHLPGEGRGGDALPARALPRAGEQRPRAAAACVRLFSVSALGGAESRQAALLRASPRRPPRRSRCAPAPASRVPRSQPLLGVGVDRRTGSIQDYKKTVGAPVDSYFEYLLKVRLELE